MNYKEFMEAVEEKLSIMSEKEKTKWIHNIARTAKGHERIEFLNSLNEKQDNRSVPYEMQDIEEWCRKVEEGEVYFECSAYEEYGEDYRDKDYEYDYYDIFKIRQDIYKSFQAADDLLFNKEYKEASILYDRILSISFSVLDRDTEEWNQLELEEVIEEELITIDFKQIVLNAMYSTYQTAKGKERTNNLYRYLTWNKCRNLKIEEIFRIGPEELKGIDSFMDEWISFLIDMDGDRAGELLLEACLYKGGIDHLCKTAKIEYLKHPILYIYACEYLLNKNEDAECEKLGLEAIRVLPENLILRGQIANLTAKAAVNLRHHHIVNKCYEVAFYSESTLNNYFRLFELPDYENITKKAVKYIETLPEHSKWEIHYYKKQMMVNSLSRNHKDIIKFFSGEFDYIYDKCKNDNSALGWSSGFNGIAVPLFILLLNKDNKITKAQEKLINGIIHRLGFEGDDKESFLDTFLIWRENVNLTKKQYEQYILWLKEEVDNRTEAVVGGGYRHSYCKAAVLIAALGETLESNGIINGKMDLIEHYKKIHSRKRAFKAEFELLNE